MADRKISELTNITGANLADDDEFALVDTSADETKAITFGEFKTALDTATGFVRITGDTMTGNLTVPNVVVSGNVDGRDVSADGTKLDGIEAGADVTDTTNVTAAGALMDSELSNLAAVKAINQGLSTSDSPSFDAVTVGSTSDPSSEMTILSSIGGTSELRLGDTDVDAGSIKYFNSNDQLVLRAAAATRVIFSSTGAAITGKTTTDELDLNAIAATISDTAVDIFVYDTRKDSDGGAWRKRTQGTSWYNETLNTATRGSRKEFPSVAVIVCRTNTLTIYDGDDPDLPMWMVFNTVGSANTSMAFLGGTTDVISSCSISNGTLVITIGNASIFNGIRIASFISEEMNHVTTQGYRTSTDISERNTQKDYGNLSLTGSGIVNNVVNDVAMTVLPNAPIDAATGLPVPTIAVATDGGVSVIKDDGTVVDITNSNSSFNVCHSITLNESGRLSFVNGYSLGGNSWVYVFNSLPSADNVITINTKTGSTQDAGALYDARGSSVVYEDLVLIGGQDDINAITESSVGVTAGLTLLDENTTTASKGMVAYTTSSYNTGWMNGDIKLATLSDTDATNVTGSELVTNGTFDTDTSGWTDYTSSYMTLSHASGAARLTYASNFSAWYGIGQDITTVVGKTYVASYEVTESDSGMEGSYFYLGDSTILYGVSGSPEKSGTITGTFVATSTTTNIRTGHGGAGVGSGDYYTVDNFTVRLAEEDRSVNGNGLQVFGTVTKSAVATGADLVAYSGFSASNYLEQPYNSDLDFGTGDFFATVWVKPDTMTSYNYIFDKSDSDGTNRFALYVTPSNVGGGAIEFFTPAHPNKYSSSIPTGAWTHVAWARKDNVSYGYINGQLQTQFYSNENLTGDSTAQLYVGVRYTKATSSSLNEGSIALLRISATAPSPEQIAKIYEDEKHLFQDNAQATLYGSSDAVTALAYDDTTELLHVGTSAGRSVFQGLRRVDNTTTAVGAAISASNGLVADE